MMSNIAASFWVVRLKQKKDRTVSVQRSTSIASSVVDPDPVGGIFLAR
jgi:hypothetical protein